MRSRILVVEDDPDIRHLVRATLTNAKYDVDACETGEQALQLARQQKHALILMDISLPGGLDGFQVTRQLRDDPSFRDTIIVALTAHAMPGDRDLTLAAGCDDYWTKPILDLNQFVAKVETLLALKGTP